MATRIFRPRKRPLALWAALLAGLAVVLLSPGPAGALSPQDGPTVGEQMIGERQFVGTPARDGVVVRSGASTEHTTIMTLSRDQEVTVVNGSGKFLRIIPPEGSFCLVPTAPIKLTGQTQGQAKIGRVTETCSVRAGSRISVTPGEITARLSADQEVLIIGEDSGYYRVVPPKGVFYYVHQDDLKRGREVNVTETAQGWAIAEVPTADAVADNTQQGGQDAGVTDPTGEQTTPPEASQAPPVAEMPDVVIPTTQPAILTAIRELDERYAAVSQLPLTEQPLDELREGYAAQLAAAEADPAMAGAIPALRTRIDTIALRQEAIAELTELQAMREKAAKRQQNLEAEGQELAERAQGAKISKFNAVGELQPSTLQVGSGALFRLCDPANGRTLIYLRAEGEAAQNLARHVEQFVGINGEITHDEELDLKFIKVAKVAAVDPEQVFKSVAAEIIPPSLVQSAGTAE